LQTEKAEQDYLFGFFIGLTLLASKITNLCLIINVMIIN